MSEKIDELLRDYPITLELPVLWGDMDSFGHVNNLIYLRWFESIRIAYLEAFDGMDRTLNKGMGPILGHVDCRYRIPVEYPDTITVGARVTEIGEDRVTMHQRVVSHLHQKVAAEGSGVMVCFDYENGVKAAVPDSWRQAIERLEG